MWRKEKVSKKLSFDELIAHLFMPRETKVAQQRTFSIFGAAGE